MIKSILILGVLLLTGIYGFSQNRIVQGRVLSEDSSLIAGATVRAIKGNNSTITHADGTFSLLVTNEDRIEVSFIGYETSAVTLSPGENNLVVRLRRRLSALNELVVTGYREEKRKDLLGAISVVNVDDMDKGASQSAMKDIQGRVPGVYITSNGSPRGAATVRIRGITTLNNNDPLYVIDGVPTKSGLHTINQDDIASIQILKDASAAAIYGVQAANGVIIITTKSGKQEGVHINFNTSLSTQNYLSKVKMLDTKGYAKALWQANINAGTDPNATSLPFRFDYHKDQASGLSVLDDIVIDSFLDNEKTMKTANTNWFDEISHTGIIQNYDLSVSKGGETGSSYFSLGYFDNEGIIKESEFKKISLRFNSEYSPFGKGLLIGENFSINNLREGGYVPINEALQAAPMMPIHTIDGSGWGGPGLGMNDRQNPMRLIEDNKQNGNIYTRMLGNIYVEAKLFSDLTLKTNFSLDYGQAYRRNWIKSYKSGFLENPLNRVTMQQWHDLTTIWSNTLDYTHTFGKSTVNLFGGMEYNLERYSIFTTSREDYVIENPEFMWLDAGSGQKDNSGYGLKNALVSYFGKLNYNFSDRYLAAFTIRKDGSSRFGQNNRFGIFPSFALGWQMGEETFVKNMNLFDQLKIRYNWGVNGNQDISNSAIFSIYSVDYNNTSYDINGVGSGTLPSGYLLDQTANRDLKWETTTQSDIGMDFSIKNGLVTGSVDYFVKKTKNILILPGYIAVLGDGGHRYLNGASMKNSGLEFQLEHIGRISNDLSLTIDYNMSFVNNKVTYLPDEVVNSYGGDARINETILGRTLGSFYGYVAEGIFQNQDEVDNHAAQNGKDIGRIRYKDLNGDSIINDYDRTWIGAPLPDFTYGLSVALRYKNIDFSIFLQGVHGINVNNTVKRWTDFWSVTNAGSNKGARLLNAWSSSNTSSAIPAIALTDKNDEARLSTYFIEDGSYLKVRNMQIGYSLPQISVNNFSIESLRIYMTAENAGLIYKSKNFSGLDPENPAEGYPNPLVLTFGLNLKF